MKPILSVVTGVAVAMMVAGCTRDASWMKFAKSGVEPEPLLMSHVSCVSKGRLEPYHEEWRNVKCDIQQPSSPSAPHTATITAEVYEFNNATTATPVMRTDLVLNLAYESRFWVLKSATQNSGLIFGEKWQSKDAMTPVKENSPRWKAIIRELELKN